MCILQLNCCSARQDMREAKLQLKEAGMELKHYDCCRPLQPLRRTGLLGVWHTETLYLCSHMRIRRLVSFFIGGDALQKYRVTFATLAW